MPVPIQSMDQWIAGLNTPSNPMYGVVRSTGQRQPQAFGLPAGQPNMNPILAAALRSSGPMNWQGAGQFAQAGNFANMDAGNAIMSAGHMNFGNQMQGAMGQMGGLLQNNAAAQRQAQDQALQTQLLREGRHDSNQKFTMLFNSLLAPNQRQEYRDLNGNRQSRMVSPLLQAFKDMMGGSSMSGFGASMNSFG